MSITPFYVMAKIREEHDSYGRSYVVQAGSPLEARQRLQRFLARSGCTLLGIYEEETRPVESFPSEWALPAVSPEGVAGMSGRAFVLRSLSREGFRELASVEFAATPPDEIAAGVARVCREREWMLVAFDGAVRLGRCGDELRYGIRCARVIRDEADARAVLAPMLASEEGQTFAVNAAVLAAARAQSGLLCTRRALQRLLLERSAFFVDGGAFIGPDAVDGVLAPVLNAWGAA